MWLWPVYPASSPRPPFPLLAMQIRYKSGLLGLYTTASDSLFPTANSSDMSTSLSSAQAGDDHKSNPFAPSSSRKLPEASFYDIADNKPPPPAYSRISSDDTGHVDRGDDLDLLKEYDTVILMDDSSSMTASCTSDLTPKNGESSRWDVVSRISHSIFLALMPIWNRLCKP